jgi:hypothetical protein
MEKHLEKRIDQMSLGRMYRRISEITNEGESNFESPRRQWSSTWGTCTLMVTLKHLRGYAKTSYWICKIEIKKRYFVINTE